MLSYSFRKVGSNHFLMRESRKGFGCCTPILTGVDVFQVFGTPLQVTMERQKAAYPELRVPWFVMSAMQHLIHRGLSTEGLFRLSGTQGECTLCVRVCLCAYVFMCACVCLCVLVCACLFVMYGCGVCVVFMCPWFVMSVI